VSVAARTAERVLARREALVRAELGAAPLLAALVGASFLVRTLLAWLRATPTFFADEYIYAELSRSLAEGGGPLIRGASAGFPALLQPIVTAPAWLADDVETSFRIVQTTGALAMSLAAVPVFLLARRLRLTTWTALALALLAILVPDLVYASFVLSEPFAYPLALGAVAAGMVALVKPGWRIQVAFLGLAGLAAFARLQFAVLPLCFVAAAVIVGLRERRLRTALREQVVVLAALVLGAVAFFALGPGSALGFYGDVLDPDLASPELARWFGVDALLLVYASGIVLVPGGLLGLWLALRRPRSREELAFGALALPVALALLLEAAAWGIDGNRAQERYFFYVVPLLGIAFGLYASRGWPHRLAHALMAAGLIALAARVPLSGYSAADGKTNAPTLFAAARLEGLLGDVGLASLVLALGAALLLGAVVVATRAGRWMTPLALGLALFTCAAAYAGAVSFSIANAERTRADALGPDPSFVDRSGLSDVAMLQSRSSERGYASEYLFWNRSVDTVYLLPGAEPPDSFAVTRLEIGRDGTLLASGKRVTSPLLADGTSDTVRFRDVSEVASSPVYHLLRSDEPHRLALYAPGRYEDGWLGLLGSIRLWPESVDEGLAGTLAIRLTAPVGSGDVPITVDEPGKAPREIVVAAGAPRELVFPVCSNGPWRLGFSAPSTGSVGTRFVSVRSSEPVYTADPAACSAG
jgi:hypothetical protein